MTESLTEEKRVFWKDKMSYFVRFKRRRDGWIVGKAPELLGCFSQGRTKAEALANIQEAIAAWLRAEERKRTEATPSS